MRQHRWPAALIAMILLLTLAAPAWAAPPGSADYQAAYSHLASLGIMQGKADGKPHLEDTLTRAEAVTILVNAFGEAERAKAVMGAAAFPDTVRGPDGKPPWYSGTVAVAKEKGWVQGDTAGKFNPEAKVTYAQFITMLVRTLGLGTDPTLGWPVGHLYAAGRAGIIPPDDDQLAAHVNDPIPRGPAAFYSDRAFSQVKLPTGRTILQTWLRPNPPQLKIDPVPEVTTPTYTLKGSATGATYVKVDGKAVTLGKDGSFAQTVNLNLGTNSVEVTAGDLVDNQVIRVVAIVRKNSTAGSIGVQAQGQDVATLQLIAGAQSQPLTFQVLDTNKAPIAGATVTGQVTPDALGRWDPVRKMLTAGTKPGTGALLLTSGGISRSIPVTVTASRLAKVKVTPDPAIVASGTSKSFAAQGFDVYDNPVPLGEVTWSSSGGLMLQSGLFTGTVPGRVSVVARSGAVSGSAAVDVAGPAVALQITADGPLVANGAGQTTLTVKAVDQNGVLDAKYEGPITFVLSQTGTYSLSASSIYIKGGTGTVTLRSNARQAGQAVGVAVYAGLPSSQGWSTSAGTLRSGSLVVTTVNQTLTSFKVTWDSGGVVRLLGASKLTVTMTALDQLGQPMLPEHMPYLTIRITSSNPSFDLYDAAGAVPNTSGMVVFPSSAGTFSYKVANTRLLGTTSITAEILSPVYQSIAIPTVNCTAVWQ